MDRAIRSFVPLRIELNERVLEVEKNETRQLRVTLQYTLGGERKESESTHAVSLIEKHGMGWDKPERIGLYVTHLDEAVERFARETVRGFREDERTAIVYDNLLRAIELFDALGAYGVRDPPDPENPYGGHVAGTADARPRPAPPRDPARAAPATATTWPCRRGAAPEHRDRYGPRGRRSTTSRDVRHGAQAAGRVAPARPRTLFLLHVAPRGAGLVPRGGHPPRPVLHPRPEVGGVRHGQPSSSA